MLECNFSVSNVEPMKSLLELASDMLADDRIPTEYKEKIASIVEVV